MMTRPDGKQVVFAILFAVLLVTVGLVGVESWNQSRRSHSSQPAPAITAGVPAPADTTSAAAQPTPAAGANGNASKKPAPSQNTGPLYNM